MTLIAPTAKKKWVFSSSQEKFKTMPMHNLVRGREGGGGGGGGGERGCKQGLLWEKCTSTFFHQHCLQMKGVKTALRFKLI